MATKSQGLPKDKRTSGSLNGVFCRPNFPSAIASQPPLRDRLRRWIVHETSEAVAGRFFPLVENALSALEYDLRAAASKEKARQAKEMLRAADITPTRMQRALDEAERAAENEQSTLEWIYSVQRRAFGRELAEKALVRGPGKPVDEPAEETADPESPPTPEQAFAFFLAWEELGGSSRVAAVRELLRQEDGHLPSN